jgi:hypothetical protein
MSAAAAGYGFRETGNPRSSNLSADNAHRVIDREQILMLIGFGSKEEIADADVGRAHDRKLAGDAPREPQAVAGREVHVPFPGAQPKLAPTMKARKRAGDNGREKNREQQQ